MEVHGPKMKWKSIQEHAAGHQLGYCSMETSTNINPFTAPACKISGLSEGCTDKRLQTYIFRSYNTSTFNAMRFDENPSFRQCEIEDRKAEGFQISRFS